MAKKFWQTEKFKELQSKWDLKLRETGFKDHESNGKLCQNALNSYRTQVHVIIENKQRYYELLGQRHHDEEYRDELESFIMEKRSNGESLVQIKSELKIKKKKNSLETIRKVIRYYEKKWGIYKKHKSRWDQIKKKTQR